jgi:hypothetical protein
MLYDSARNVEMFDWTSNPFLLLGQALSVIN